jgi:hypothetical protein
LGEAEGGREEAFVAFEREPALDAEALLHGKLAGIAGAATGDPLLDPPEGARDGGLIDFEQRGDLRLGFALETDPLVDDLIAVGGAFVRNGSNAKCGDHGRVQGSGFRGQGTGDRGVYLCTL